MSNFIDRVKINIRAGHGGKGCIAFRREAYVPRGGPSGGDGGKGADVIIRADSQLGTLIDLRYQQNYFAKDGLPGSGKEQTGADSEDIIIRVPVGTLVYDTVTPGVLVDLDEDGKEFIAGKGGRGGKGNAFFKTATKQTPRYAQPGEPGEERQLFLELKLLADVGLVGFPNAGKSTLISTISAAKPKIADYPFTTLTPVLGVVKPEGRKGFVVADIPGLIENAHKGAGLGFEFLRARRHVKNIFQTKVSSIRRLPDPLRWPIVQIIADPNARSVHSLSLVRFGPSRAGSTAAVVRRPEAGVGDARHLASLRSRRRGQPDLREGPVGRGACHRP